MSRSSPPRTQVHRLPHKQSHDLGTLYELLDEALVAHVGVCDGTDPFVLPMACARDTDALLLHGSTGSRLARALGNGAPVCATVTILDGLVYARSAFESSMHYRSAMILGRAARVPDTDRARALRVLTDHLLPGRAADLRDPSPRELAATRVLRLPLIEWSLKMSSDPPADPPDDLDAPIWAGVLPVRLMAGSPVDAPDLRTPQPLPDYVARRLR